MDTSNPTLVTAAEIQARLKALGHAEMRRLADLSTVPFTTLWKVRSGETSNPGVETVNKFFSLIEQVKTEKAA